MNVTYVLPGKIAGEALRADQRLYNDLIDYFETIDARLARQNISTGQQFAKAHFWYLDPHHDTLRERGCINPIECQYYSSKLVSFPPVCYYCGISEESFVEDDEIQQLREEYAVVRPLCFLCKAEGKSRCPQMSGNVVVSDNKLIIIISIILLLFIMCFQCVLILIIMLFFK